MDEEVFLSLLEKDLYYGRLFSIDGCLVKILSNGIALVIGDVHGDIKSLKTIFEDVNVEKFLSNDENILIFLGDYVDRGLYQYETLAFILLLKQEFRGQILLLRGNHEPLIQLIPYPHDFPYVLRKRFPQKWDYLYKASFNFFQRLPLASFSNNGIFFVHGGPPISDLKLSSLKDPSLKLMEEVLWSDPREDILETTPSFRGAGLYFGKNVTDRFLRINGLTAIVRGHEPCEGFKLNHDGKVVTLFSRAGPPYWNKSIGYMLVPLSSNLTLKALKDCLKNIEAPTDFNNSISYESYF
ncbi:MAG: serine/threonine protein phosphatase [Nitrososphaeria archaeon]|nr:serine/threonine protein phosphatase [Nitrososphaeria archaeon]